MFKGMQEHHQSRTIKENLSMIQHESKTANNLGVMAIVVAAILGLAAMGNIQDSDLAKREWQLEQQQRQMQNQPVYQNSPVQNNW